MLKTNYIKTNPFASFFVLNLINSKGIEGRGQSEIIHTKS